MHYEFPTVSGRVLRILYDDNGNEVTREEYVPGKMELRTDEWYPTDIPKTQPWVQQLVSILTGATFVTPNIGAATGASLAATGAITSSGGGIGYATGSGGTVTQLTSRTTTVVLNKLCGNITMFSAAQAANALVSFTLTNSFISATDFVLVQHISATNGGAWVFSTVPAAGSCVIHIRNQTTASITEATPLRFFILKAVIT